MKLYGIKNCDTVKKARRWLDEHDVDYEFHDFKQSAPDSKQLHHWCDAVGWETLLNRRGLTWRKLDDRDRQNVDAEQAVRLMQQHPTLIKRPVIESGKAVLVGFNAADYQRHFG